VVLDEVALHRLVGGREVMSAQLANILENSALPNTVVQVLPYEFGVHPVVESNFTHPGAAKSGSWCSVRRRADRSTYLERPQDIEEIHGCLNTCIT
jgi:hypothetical protein